MSHRNDLTDMTLEKFKMWTVPNLKSYLRERDYRVSGTKEYLVARAFSAWEMKAPAVISQQEREKILAKSYRDLLTTPKGNLPDPLTELDCWLNESEGLKKWPHTRIEDLSVFLKKMGTDTDTANMTDRLLSDYKDQKAYSYFSSRWLLEIFYHPISEGEEFCFLKTKCKPSQNINDDPHDVWICIEKFTGEIQSAYCTCFAG